MSQKHTLISHVFFKHCHIKQSSFFCFFEDTSICRLQTVFFFKFVHVFLTEDELNQQTRERMNIKVVTDPFHQNYHTSCCESFKSTEYLNLSHVIYEACEQFYSKLRSIYASVALVDLEHFLRAVSIFIAYNNNRAHIDIMK